MINKITKNNQIRAAVLLSGSGVYDGSEISETSSLLIALSKNNIKYQCYAPNTQQQVIDHITGNKMNETRNVLTYSSRIARGNIKPLNELSVMNYDSLFLPGGFGVANNLSDYGMSGVKLQVNPLVEETLKNFHSNNKPIGLACISPILVAKIFGSKNNGPGLELTLGNKGEEWTSSDAIDVAQQLGNNLVDSKVSDVCIDFDNNIFTSPAYMHGNATPSEIYDSMSNLVAKVVERISLQIPISLIIDVEVIEEYYNEFVEVLRANAQGSRTEPGCLRWDLLQDTQNKYKFTFYEVYESQDAIEYHKTTSHYLAWAQLKDQGKVNILGKKVVHAIDYRI